MSGGIQRFFLGWEGSALDRAAEWLLERHGEDLKRLLVALPGSRAARALREKLARRASPAWFPPRILTQGELIDEMVVTDRPVAARLARTLAWSRALESLPREELELVAARPPEPGDLRGALALAETVRALHAELAQEGIGFERLAGAPTGGSRRFEVLAEAQARWRTILSELGLADPHESRFAAIDAGRIEPDRQVVLVGVADMNRLLRHLVERLGGRVTALVFAPEEEARSFDALGCLETGAWKDRDLDLPLDRWHVVDGPDAQAERAVAILAGFDGRFAAEDVTIAVCDEEVAPHLERRLSEEGILAHHAAGTPLERTRPWRLLADVAAWLPRRAFPAYAALLRHRDLEFALRAGVPGNDLPAALDRYHEVHLPAEVDGRWLRGKEEEVRAGHASLLRLLGDLAADGPRPLARWPAAVRAFLALVHAEPLRPDVEEERVLAAALAVLSDALGEIEELPGALGAAPATAAEAIDLALSISRGETVAPAPPSPVKPAIELLGWLELPLDESAALVVTGFQEGFVPRSRRDDAFLPDTLRRKLGLPGADDRVARDVYAGKVLLASKTEIAFVSGRRSRRGDPLLPSRLAFHVPRKDLLARVERLEPSGARPRPAISSGPGTAGRYELPRLLPFPETDSLRVTAFRDYLRSPYAFYLEHVLRLETHDDSAREMDPLAFGSLAHGVLEAFGKSDLRDSTDAGEIEGFLRAVVEERALLRFGPRPLPAVGLQIAQLAHRLGFFAREQACRAREGWRIRHVEWEPAAKVALDMGGGRKPMGLRGKIDRIDVREAPGSTRVEWAILDYKTGGSSADPGSAHRKRDGEWRDLQLPLYTLLARELALEGEPRLGYFKIGRDAPDSCVACVDWTRPDLDDAVETARAVATLIRNGEFFELGRLPDEPILCAIAGQGLVETAEEDDAEEEAPE